MSLKSEKQLTSEEIKTVVSAIENGLTEIKQKHGDAIQRLEFMLHALTPIIRKYELMPLISESDLEEGELIESSDSDVTVDENKQDEDKYTQEDLDFIVSENEDDL